jgi:hypothetical protein
MVQAALKGKVANYPAAGVNCPVTNPLLDRTHPAKSGKDGHVAEWLRSGLQIRVPEFDSRRGLHFN